MVWRIWLDFKKVAAFCDCFDINLISYLKSARKFFLTYFRHICTTYFLLLRLSWLFFSILDLIHKHNYHYSFPFKYVQRAVQVMGQCRTKLRSLYLSQQANVDKRREKEREMGLSTQVCVLLCSSLSCYLLFSCLYCNSHIQRKGRRKLSF